MSDIENAKNAGWNPEDGDPPYEHGEFQEGLDAEYVDEEEPRNEP